MFEDNGIGVSVKLLDKIFDMFFRATEKSEGAGLSLYIVRETIDKLRGAIKVDSIIGEGIRFKIIISNCKQLYTLGV